MVLVLVVVQVALKEEGDSNHIHNQNHGCARRFTTCCSVPPLKSVEGGVKESVKGGVKGFVQKNCPNFVQIWTFVFAVKAIWTISSLVLKHLFKKATFCVFLGFWPSRNVSVLFGADSELFHLFG